MVIMGQGHEDLQRAHKRGRSRCLAPVSLQVSLDEWKFCKAECDRYGGGGWFDSRISAPQNLGGSAHLRKRAFLRNEANKSFFMNKIIFASGAK